MPTPSSLQVRVQKSQARLRKRERSQNRKMGIGEFFLLIDITANDTDVYIPLSIASGKKPAGFVYQIEGTRAQGIAGARVSYEGNGISEVTVGTLLYCKIPRGKVATFRLLIDIEATLGGEYKVGISRIHYKHSPSDARYEKFTDTLYTKTLKAK